MGMACADRQQLFERYYDQVSVCFALLKKPNRWGWLLGDDEAYKAVEAAVHARTALEQHEREHGCGKLCLDGFGEAADGSATRPTRDETAEGLGSVPLWV
ncbi:MAG TPA: hypothetical protein VMG40_06250 [Bryobacteraceae bacterium]|nr:hypothetical protein [Bryobacteraceae bacterium]